jgi:multicomponent Na+:H+ antiporter subunit C
MTMPLVLVLTAAVLFGAGVYLLLDRSLTRILLGFLMLGNAANLLLFLSSGSFGEPPLVDGTDPADMSDPLPQALTLTAIVTTFGVSAFVLALIYRSWVISRRAEEDAVQRNEEDVALAETAAFTTEEVTDEDLAQAKEFEQTPSDGESDR